jgi:hypothetical protein
MEMNLRILVSGESDEAQLARGARFEEGGIGSLGIENPMGIIEANDLMMLDEVEAIDLEPLERFFDLARGFFLCASVDFRHQENFFSVTVAERFAHAFLAFAIVIIPGVIHEIDSTIDRSADNAGGKVLFYLRQGEMPSA